MRTLYALGVALLAAPTYGQLMRPAFEAHPEGKHHGGYAVPGHQLGSAKGTTYFSEPFDAGLNGWTVNTPSGVDWAWTDVGPGPTTSTYPVPPLNSSSPSGWVIVDDDFLGQGLTTETSLISPVIDLSMAPQFLKLEFEQYFQEWQEDHCYVGVSTDGGVTWDETEIGEGVGRDGRPNPELVDLDISSWVANDPANVQLRFRYTSIWDYGWQIDNVTITDLPENDMALLRARLTGFDFDNTGLANIDYSIYPLSQVRGMQLNGEVKNKGYATQTNTMLNVSVDGPMGNEFTGSSNSLDMAAAQVEFPSVNGFVPSGDLGTYTVTFEVVQDQTDEDPSNNGDTQSFMVSSNEWAQDDGVCESTQSRGPDNQNEAFWLGNRVDPVVDDQLVAIKVALHEDTDPNVLIQGQVLDGTDAVIAMSNEYEVLPGDLNPIGGSNFITLTFDQPVDLLAGEAYTLMVATFGGPEEVVFCTSGISVPQVSLIHYPQMATPNFFYVTKTPMVRGVMAGPIGIDENNGPLAGGLSLLPNPADGFTDVRFELLTSAQVSTELRDASGRTVMIAQPTRMSAGPQTVRMDLEALAPGLYLHTLVVDGQRNTVRLVVR